MPEQKLILYVEDEPDRSQRRVEMLNDKHPEYKIIFATDDEKATIMFKKIKFELVILDIRMNPAGNNSIVNPTTPPRQVGLELLRALRNNRIEESLTSFDVPVIVISAIINKEDISDIMSCVPPPIAYIEKPGDLFKFLATVEAALN